MSVDWEDLGAAALARQFPPVVDGLLDVAGRIGPVQTQTARSAYLGLAARVPGLDPAALTGAYETHALVRGSTLRGTVHTSTAAQHRLLDATTRVAQRALWTRTLRLRHHTLEEVWSAIEEFSHDAWRTPAELHEFLTGWLEARGEVEHRLGGQAGRYFAFGHGGLVRRPLAGGWHGQGAPGYRAATVVTGRPLPATERAVRETVELHLRCHGPASRHDIAWWSGLGLRQVDEVLAELDTRQASGPDERVYHQLPGSPDPIDLPGVRLLPEFDALLCGYDPAARLRFGRAEHLRRLWNQTNGLLLAPLLVDGRITGFWRLEGSGRTRELAITWFAGTRRPRKAELDEPARAATRVLGLRVDGITLTREDA